MQKGIIIAGGELTAEFAGQILTGTERESEILLAAADGGLEVLDRLHRAPDLLLGDFDTVRKTVLEAYENRPDLTVQRHNPVKDASDLELTVDWYLDRGIREVLVLGALGGRADHTLANMRLTYYAAERGMNLMLLDPLNRIRCAAAGPEACSLVIRRDSQWGKYVGFFPIGGTISDLTLEGFRYPLEHFRLDDRTSPSLTISNEIAAEEGRIRFSGTEGSGLIIMETRDRKGI